MLDCILSFICGYFFHVLVLSPTFTIFSEYAEMAFQSNVVYVPFDYRYKLAKVKYFGFKKDHKFPINQYEGVPLLVSPQKLGYEKITAEWFDENDELHYKTFVDHEIPQLQFQVSKPTREEKCEVKQYIHEKLDKAEDQE